jgi:hypothetical protein
MPAVNFKARFAAKVLLCAKRTTMRPIIVCLCGSTRFIDAFRKANLEETLRGRIVLSIGRDTKSDTDLVAMGELTEEVKERLVNRVHVAKRPSVR